MRHRWRLNASRNIGLVATSGDSRGSQREIPARYLIVARNSATSVAAPTHLQAKVLFSSGKRRKSERPMLRQSSHVDSHGGTHETLRSLWRPTRPRRPSLSHAALL